MQYKSRISVTPPVALQDGAGNRFELVGFDQGRIYLKHTHELDLKKQGSLSLQTFEQLDLLPGPLEMQHSSMQQEGYQLASFVLSSATDHTTLLHRFRKSQHIDICQNQPVEGSHSLSNGFDAFSFLPKTIPELNWEHLSTKTEFLNRGFDLPFLITGMTGGVDQGTKINQRLAKAAAKFNIPMGVGSQRMALEDPELAYIFKVKDSSPDIFLIGNLGIAQLLDTSPSAWTQAVRMIDADAFALHLNVLQELVQVEGDRNFQGVKDIIKRLKDHLDVPLIIKEVGAGMDVQTAQSLLDIGVDAIDIAGTGGTSWAQIEGLRAGDSQTQRLGKVFQDWGIPTAHSLAAVKNSCKNSQVIATGGVRNGLIAAKALALGATMVGIGLPLFKAALVSEQKVEYELECMTRELKTTMLLTGCQSSRDLVQATIHKGRSYSREFDAFLSLRSQNL